MTKIQFLNLMHFPSSWQEGEMYPDELFDWQVKNYQPGHEDGAEHDRNGAFHWWLRRNPSKEQLERLLRLAYADPDRALGEDILAHLRKAEYFDEELAALAADLFGDSAPA